MPKFGRNAGAGVLYRQDKKAITQTESQRYLSSGGGVAQSIVDEISHQDCKKLGMAGYAFLRCIAGIESKLDALGCRLGREIPHDRAQDFHQVDGATAVHQRCGFDPRQREKLRHELCCAFGSGQHALKRHLALLPVACGKCHLGVGANGGQGRAQFMRSVGGKPSVAFANGRDAGEVVVQCGDQRQLLARGVVGREGLGVGRRASCDRLGETVEGASPQRT